jgi:hypothetical protein
MRELASDVRVQDDLGKYLNEILLQKPNFPRKWCCGTSRSLYCSECGRLLIEKEFWPSPLQTGQIQLPFDLDVVLSDRRRAATGFHALVLLQASRNCDDYDHTMKGSEVTSDIIDHDETKDIWSKNTFSTVDNHVRLFDIKNGASLPNYEDDDQVFVLFPSETSIPLSSVSARVKRLVVLDCKWTKVGTQQQLHEISHLPQVHLDESMIPAESYFWRWHNAGSNCISTLEAIYYAALQVSRDTTNPDNSNPDYLIHLMWLFGIQRALTSYAAEKRGKEKPFSEEGKEQQRLLRRTIKGSEKHLRDIQIGRKLREKVRTSRSDIKKDHSDV